MKAGKKMATKAQKRGIHHNNASNERRKKTHADETELAKAFKAPGSMNKKKLGAC